MGPCQTHTHTLSLSLSLCSSLSHTSVSPFHPPLSNSFIVSSAVVAAFAEKRTRRTCTSIKTGLSQEIRDLIAGKCLEPRVISPVYRDSVAPLRLFPPRRPPPNQRYPFRVVGSFLDPSFNCPCSGKAFSFSRLTKQVADCDFFLDRRNFLSWRRAGKAGKSLEGFRRRGTLIRGLVWRSMTIDALILICRVIDVTNIDIRVSFFFFFISTINRRVEMEKNFCTCVMMAEFHWQVILESDGIHIIKVDGVRIEKIEIIYVTWRSGILRSRFAFSSNVSSLFWNT